MTERRRCLSDRQAPQVARVNPVKPAHAPPPPPPMAVVLHSTSVTATAPPAPPAPVFVPPQPVVLVSSVAPPADAAHLQPVVLGDSGSSPSTRSSYVALAVPAAPPVPAGPVVVGTSALPGPTPTVAVSTTPATTTNTANASPHPIGVVVLDVPRPVLASSRPRSLADAETRVAVSDSYFPLPLAQPVERVVVPAAPMPPAPLYVVEPGSITYLPPPPPSMLAAPAPPAVAGPMPPSPSSSLFLNDPDGTQFGHIHTHKNIIYIYIPSSHSTSHILAYATYKLKIIWLPH